MRAVARLAAYIAAGAEPRPDAPTSSARLNPRPSRAVDNHDIDCMIIYWIWLKCTSTQPGLRWTVWGIPSANGYLLRRRINARLPGRSVPSRAGAPNGRCRRALPADFGQRP